MHSTTTFRPAAFTRSDSYSARNGLAELSNDDLRARAPSIFADSPWERMSDRYKFVPTIEVVEWLREEGFSPVRALQSRSRIEGKSSFTKHMVRFRHKDHLGTGVSTLGQEFPEMTLVNSHDGTSTYCLYQSIFRSICLNGLIVHSQDLDGISVRHKGGADFHNEIIDASYRIISEIPQVMAQIEEFKQIALTPPQQTAMATAALELQSSDVLKPEHILRTRRSEDNAGTVWTTFNTIQENMIKGGIRSVNRETGRRSTTKGVKSVTGDVSINRALWRLSEEMSRLVN